MVSKLSNGLTPIVRRALLIKLHSYVGHSFHIYKATSSNWHLKKMEEIDKVKNLISEFDKGYPLAILCFKIYKIREKLINILPLPTNSSYESSKLNLEEIILFCKSVLNIQS